MSVTLINHSGRCLALNLPHAAVSRVTDHYPECWSKITAWVED